MKKYIYLLIILVAGLFLRLYHNLDISLWHDEAFSALLIKYPWGEMFYRIGLDVHPPVYYVVLRLWSYAVGDSLLALRGFSVLFGLLTSLAGYAFVKTAFKSEKVAIVTALLIAINPFQIQYATEARMYTFGAFLVVLDAFILVKALQVSSRKKQAIYYFLFGLVSGLAILTHYYLLFTIAALCFYALCYHIYTFRFAFKKYLLLLTSYLLLALVFAPWFKWFLYQFKQGGAGYGIPSLERWSSPTTLGQRVLGFGIDITQRNTQVMVVLATLFTIYFLIQFIRKTESSHKWLVLLALIAPFAGSLLFAVLAYLKGENTSVYLVRYFLYTSPFYTAALAVWLTNIRRQYIMYVLLVIYALCNLGAFWHYWQDLDVKNKPGMAGAVEYIKNSADVTDKMYVGSSFEYFNLKYYAEQSSTKSQNIRYIRWSGIPTPKLFSGGNTSIKNLPHFAGTAILTDQDLLPRFEDGAHQGDTVWLLWTNGFGGSKPVVPENFTQLEEKGFAEVRPYVGTWITVTKYLVH